ncbi:hypothetical protein ACXLRP_003515, partial [Acinetobacter baumannii]|nr:hypothetical protein [Acinetobacter baumannii]EKW2534401.1 hypothetical protein [Acinetobacter baumannii]
MDNYKSYKVRVENDDQLFEGVSLFEALGYKPKGSSILKSDNFLFATSYGLLQSCENAINSDGYEWITLPQLRDLVAQSKSNLREYLDSYDNYKLCLINPSEAAHWMIEVPEGADCLMQWPTGHKVFYKDNFAKSWNSAYREWQFVSGDDGIDQSSTLWKRATQDPALISGAEAKLAWANGEIVEYFSKSRDEWFEVKGNTFVSVFDSAEKLRIKPQTIKLELELPKPFEPEEDCHVYILDDGKTDGYRRYSYEVHGDKGNTFIGIWRTEEEVKQVVEQLRKIRG